MRSKFKRALAFTASLAMCSTMLLYFPSGTFDIRLPVKAVEGDVEINEENFPDEIFRTYVDEYFDTTDDGILTADEIAAVTGSMLIKRESLILRAWSTSLHWRS